MLPEYFHNLLPHSLFIDHINSPCQKNRFFTRDAGERGWRYCDGNETK